MNRPAFKAYSLIEIIAVITVLIILAAIILMRVGDVRGASYGANASRLEKEFHRAVEDLASNGVSIYSAVQTAAISCGSVGLKKTADPDYMGLDSVQIQISKTDSPNAGALKGVLTAVNDALSTAGNKNKPTGAVRIPTEEALGQMLQKYDAAVILVFQKTTLHSVFLKLTQTHS